MPACKDVHDVRRFLGLANQLGRFSPNLASLSQPLRDLLVKRNSWCWTESHQTAFDSIKAELSSQPVLALYSPNYETVVSADVSSYGLGAVLTQRQPDTGLFRPVVYLSRSLIDTERRYSQIEKEALATTWACERLSNYLIGLPLTVETDHKPLVPFLGTKALDELPPRVLRFRLRLMRYQLNIVHVPGKNLITADALSRAPADVSSVADSALEQEVDAFMAAVTDGLPATDQRLQEILTAQQGDPICTTIGSYCSVWWPPQDRLSAALKPYWRHRSDFSSTPDGLLLFGQRIVIPAALRLQVLDQIHTGHQGIMKCRQHARQSVWWPGISAHLLAHVENCQTCARQRMQPVETTDHQRNARLTMAESRS